MSVLNDDRVSAREDGGFTVVRDGGDPFVVLYRPPFEWTVCHGPHLEYVPVEGGGFATGFPSAEAAVEAALARPARR